MAGPPVLIAGRYRLVEQIASGGMGSVWEAWDERLQRRVALKQLHPQPGLSAAEARLASNRALREARITARLHHAHAVPVYDVVDHDGMPCLIMQYLPSRSLQSVLTERGTLSVAEVARIGSEVAAALAAAHAAGIIHRDVKPGNVLIDAAGSAKITDFGISHALGDVSLTSTGIVTGTPAFLAPEVARGQKSSFASDVFSLGATLYAASEGRAPFGTGENPMAVLHRVASGPMDAPERSGQLTPVLTAMLAADPARRPSMAEAASTLAALHVAATDPKASARTQPLDTAPPVTPPPSKTVSLPPVRVAPDPGRERPSHAGRYGAIAVLVLLLVGGGIVLARQLSGRTHHQAGPNHSPAASDPPSHPSTHVVRSSPSVSGASHTSDPPASTGTNSTATTTGNSSSPTQQIQAVDSYYALLPGNTAAAWDRLTPGYQTQTGGRSSFDRFWGSFRSVQISNEHTRGDQVVADLAYTSTSGKVSTETRSFTLVNDGGVLKIAASGVVSA